MNKPYITAILAITRIAFKSGSIEKINSENDYMSARKCIANEFKSDMERCKSFTEEARNICITVAKHKVKLAKIDLDIRYSPHKYAE